MIHAPGSIGEHVVWIACRSPAGAGRNGRDVSRGVF